MYSEDDLNSAVAAGALSPEAVRGFRDYMTQVREIPRGSEENFRLINSFNDIFVSIGVVILLIAVGSIAGSIGEFGGGQSATEVFFSVFLPSTALAVTAWALSEFFTRRRRMALPSIILLLTFVGAVLFASVSIVAWPISFILGVDSMSETELSNADIGDYLGASLVVFMAAMTSLITTFATWQHWKRFMVPITVAAGAGALALSVIGGIAVAFQVVASEALEFPILPIVLITGIAIFAFAMHWDISDRDRVTRRSDVAFWLHLLAAPMIVHPIFAMLGVTDGYNIGIGAAVGVLAVYIAFGVLALVVDRRALLVSALAYVLVALTFLFDKFGAVELNFALTALVIGSALLSLSAFWQPIRKTVVSALPQGFQDKLPATSDLTPAPAEAGAG